MQKDKNNSIRKSKLLMLLIKYFFMNGLMFILMLFVFDDLRTEILIEAFHMMMETFRKSKKRRST